MSGMHDNTFKGLPNDDEVIARAQDVFRSACENADSSHTLRLGLARRKAIHARTSHPAARMFAAMGGAAVACCALAIGVVVMRPASRTAAPAGIATSTANPADPTANLDDLPEVGSSQMEMVQDLDFYRWVASQPKVATAAARGAR